MLGDSTVLATSGNNVAATATATAATIRMHEGGDQVSGGVVGNISNSGEDDKSTIPVLDEGDRGNYGGNRWPREETLALLKIRSDMDQVFRDSSHKGPLWEDVSRKLAELGYNRSAKKCKEKFENVYKYHKRTKEGRTGKSEGKTYRFFDQLEAFDSHPSHSTTPPVLPPPPPPPKPQTPTTTTATLSWNNNPPNASYITIPSTTTNPINIIPQNIVTSSTTNPIISTPFSSQPNNVLPSSFQNISTHLFSSSTSSSTASDEELEVSRKRKRKLKDFFQRLTRDVIKKQEELQKKFLETVEKHEHERMVREEYWRMQEMARINREHDILIQERSTTAAKDAALIAVLQKLSGQQNTVQTNVNLPPTPQLVPVTPTPLAPQALAPQVLAPALPQPPRPPPANSQNLDIQRRGDNSENAMSSSSRWPKAEVLALIKLRTNLDNNYQENGPKGALWEEISAGMQRLGYNRSAKRCKEKWENINKYFKKVKESNKKRPEDSKTCPYFHELDALYREKNRNSVFAVNAEPIMVRPEQQWPLQQPRKVMEDKQREINIDQNMEDDDHHQKEGLDEDGEDTEEEFEADDFEVVPNKSVASLGNGE